MLAGIFHGECDIDTQKRNRPKHEAGQGDSPGCKVTYG